MTASPEPQQQVDVRNAPFYYCTCGDRKFLLIKTKLDAEQMGVLRYHMNSLAIRHIEQRMSPEERAEIQRTVDSWQAAMASRSTGGVS